MYARTVVKLLNQNTVLAQLTKLPKNTTILLAKSRFYKKASAKFPKLFYFLMILLNLKNVAFVLQKSLSKELH